MLLQNQKIYIIRYLPTYLLKHSTNLLIPKKLKKFKQPITLLHTVILLPSHKKILQSPRKSNLQIFGSTDFYQHVTTNNASVSTSEDGYLPAPGWKIT